MASTDNSAATASGDEASYDPSKDPKRKAKSNDPGWKYGYWPNIADKNTVRCTLCNKDLKGGIRRLKEHLVGGYGDAIKCTKTTAAIAEKMNAVLLKNKKRAIVIDLDNEYDDVQQVIREEHLTPTSTEGGTYPSIGSEACSKKPSSGTASKRLKSALNKAPIRGPVDMHVRLTPEEVVDDRRAKGTTQTTIFNRMKSTEEKKQVDNHIADWVYQCGIPFNAVKTKSFEVMVESIAQYGSGYKPPTYHEIRVPLLKNVKERIMEMRKSYERYWKMYGCTLMFDGWTDKKGRHLINFLVNCPERTFFLGSMDATSHVQDAKMLFELLDSKVEEIGEEHVIQVVTANASNYKAAGALLMEKRTTLYWTPSAAHCLDLMLEDIGNLKQYKKVIIQAKRIITFIYRHTRLLEALRQKTNGRDLVRATVTRFATSFLTLQRLLKHKDDLRHLFISEEWTKSNFSKTEVGKRVAETTFTTAFWHGVEDYFRASQPLMIVLRIVDTDERLALPEVFVAMQEAKKRIKDNFGGKEQLWKQIIQIIDRRWECQMERPLYGAALFLNPGKFYNLNVVDDCELISSLQTSFNEVVTRLVPDISLQDKILHQASEYKQGRSPFFTSMAIRQRTIMSPLTWWDTHGGNAFELTRIARRILGLCCSSSGCERNWSTFEFIYTKKRNRLEHERLNDLAFIQYNRRLQERFSERRLQSRNYDPLLLDELDWSNKWMVSQPNDLVHPEGDLTWSTVDRAMGASASLEGHNRLRRGQPSESTSARVNLCYSRRRSLERVVEEYDSESDEDMEQVEDLNDDENIVDDYGFEV